MAVKTGEHIFLNDVYIDYPYEEVMFRSVKANGGIYRKFYGEKESAEKISESNRLFNDALLMGDEITKDEYERGKST